MKKIFWLSIISLLTGYGSLIRTLDDYQSEEKCQKTILYLQNCQQQSVAQLKEAENTVDQKVKSAKRIEIHQKFVGILEGQLKKLCKRCPDDIYEAFLDYYEKLRIQIQKEIDNSK